jgi:hypothetical protein
MVTRGETRPWQALLRWQVGRSASKARILSLLRSLHSAREERLGRRLAVSAEAELLAQSVKGNKPRVTAIAERRLKQLMS